MCKTLYHIYWNISIHGTSTYSERLSAYEADMMMMMMIYDTAVKVQTILQKITINI